jgi:DNA-binding response OmpR family regulator
MTTERVTDSKLVVAIDDDAMIRGLVKSILEAEGYLVRTAEDGLAGVTLIESFENPFEEIALIVIDVVMPNMNGLDVVNRLKLKPETQKIPVLMLTGEDRAEDIMSGYSVGADYYITKPFTRQQLLFGLEVVMNASWDK